MRRVLAVVLCAVSVLVAACDPAPPPGVTFFAQGRAIDVAPTDYCRAATACAHDDGAGATLRVPAGRPLQISVPAAVAEAPWVVLFSYRPMGGGADQDGRTQVFARGSRYAYTLELPEPGDQLREVQVQRIGLITSTEEGTGAAFSADAVWVLHVESP